MASTHASPKKRLVKVNKTAIKKLLQTGEFDPNKPGPMKIVAETGNAEYWTRRAIEELSYALNEQSKMVKQSRYKTALSLIALAMFPNAQLISELQSKPTSVLIMDEKDDRSGTDSGGTPTTD